MSEASLHSMSEKPSAVGSFLRGFFSSAFNSALMMGIFFSVAALVAITPVIATTFVGVAAQSIIAAPLLGLIGSTAVTSLAIGLFGGVMAAKRAMFDTASAGHHVNTTYVPVPVAGINSPAIAAPAPALSADAPEQAAPSQSWVTKTGRDSDSSNRIQQILNSTMSDKDRASAILAEREVANAAPLTAAR